MPKWIHAGQKWNVDMPTQVVDTSEICPEKSQRTGLTLIISFHLHFIVKAWELEFSVLGFGSKKQSNF